MRRRALLMAGRPGDSREHVALGRRGEFSRRAVEDEVAVEEDGDAVGEALELLEVLRREDDCPAPVGDGAGQLPETPPLPWVERGGGGGLRSAEDTPALPSPLLLSCRPLAYNQK